ncbi:MAG: DEAD/DEAH box helicase, partial [Acidimicrobiales bacterium]
MSSAPLIEYLPDLASPDELLVGFLSYAEDQGLELYEAQEVAILELFSGNSVILNTPTGSGKSLVAMALHFFALANNTCSVYTAPVKALVSEKFFALCEDFGVDNVGMMTGDAAVNPDAPILCCTAEILANLALRDGDKADLSAVVMDEFHYYSDRDRGMAWQVPLLTLPQAQFLLMSATMGETDFFVEEITARTDTDAVLVKSTERPVPLSFEYRTTPLHESLQELLDTKRVPVYIVHFTQKSATDAAQNLTSINVLSSEEKQQIKEAIVGFGFDSPIGKDLKRFVLHGIGVHHAGLLPKYRLLVERLAKQGLLKIICGTDTLGVGVNVPIRTVLFTQLCKWDGRKTRVLSVRDFQQIAGRAGRKGFDDHGWVWVQAPEHTIENLRLDAKAAQDPKKKRKFVKKKPPDRGYAHWDANTLTKLSGGTPEQLKSQFNVSHAMMLHLLTRPGDGCASTRKLLVDNHESRRNQRRHIRRAIAIYRSLVEADILEIHDEPDDLGRLISLHPDLQEDFRLNQPLSP